MKISVITPSIRPSFLDIAQGCLERQTFEDFEWHCEIGLRNRGYHLPSDWNKLLRRCQGEIIVMYQDCITIPDDFLEEVVALDYEKRAYTFPLRRENGSYDWRKYRKEATGQTRLTANNWEIDLASAPRALFFDVGGFDEDFDNGWSWENVEIGWRAEAAGYVFHVEPTLEGSVFDHDAIIENPFRNKRENNDGRANRTMERARRGDFKLSYL